MKDAEKHAKELGGGITAEFDLDEGQVVTFILREPIKEEDDESKAVLLGNPDVILNDTSEYWVSRFNSCD